MKFFIKIRMLTDDDCIKKEFECCNTDDEELYRRHEDALLDDLKNTKEVDSATNIDGTIIIDSKLDSKYDFHKSIKLLLEREKKHIHFGVIKQH